MELKPCPFRVHGERKASCAIPEEYYYNETFMPCLEQECPCYHEDTGDAWCDRSGAYMKLNRRADATVVIHAKWKDNGNKTVSCSHCATWFPKERKPYLRYCGWCGAKIDG